MKDCECTKQSASLGWNPVFIDSDGYLYANVYSLGVGPGGGGHRTDFFRENPSNGPSPKFATNTSGYYHTLAVDTDGKAWSFGTDNNNRRSVATPGLRVLQQCTGIPSNVRAVQVSAGYYTSFVLGSDNKIYRSGTDEAFSLGDNQETVSGFTPLNLNALANQNSGVAPIPVQIYATSSRSLFLDSNDKVWYAGVPFDATSTAYQKTHKKITGSGLPSNYKAVEVLATLHNIIIRLDNDDIYIVGEQSIPNISGTVSTFGKLKFDGQLRLSIQQSTDKVKSIYIGNSLSKGSRVMVLTDTNKLYGKGYTEYGELGTNVTWSRNCI